jgi:hypothetical protein
VASPLPCTLSPTDLTNQLLSAPVNHCVIRTGPLDLANHVAIARIGSEDEGVEEGADGGYTFLMLSCSGYLACENSKETRHNEDER